MKILRKTFDLILLHTPLVPPETGGILGGKNHIISDCVFDSGSNISNGYDIYAPDTKRLNRVIRKWSEIGIEFYGIFHSHFPNGTMLSNGDKRYVKRIVLNMPMGIDSLYFPIVFPQESMVVYRVDRQEHDVLIVHDQIEIL